MRRTWFKNIVRTATVLLLLPLVLILWLIGTESGLRVIYHYATDYLPGNLQIEKLEGSFVGPMIASNIHYKQNELRISADKLTLEWLPAALFTNNVSVSKLHIASLKIHLPSAEKSTSDQPITLPDINLPWRVAVKDVVINGISINQTGQNIIGLKQVKLNATSLFNKLTIKTFTMSTEQMSLNLKGQVNLSKNYQHKLNVQWRAELPAKSLIVGKGRIEGDLRSIKIKQQVDGPVEISFKADVNNLLKNISWQAEANILDINPAKVWPDWPGKFTGKLTSEGQIKAGQLLANLDVSNLTGQLRDYPVSFRSRLNWHNAGLDIQRFDLHSGNAQLSASGRIDSSIKVNWSLDSSNMANLYPHAKGQLQAKGQLSGNLSKPFAKTTFTAKALSIPDYEIGNIKGDVEMELLSWQKINAKISAQALNIKEYAIKSLDITADNHNVKATAVSDMATTHLDIKGNVDSNGGIGRIEKAEIVSSHFSDWKLKSPVNFNISNKDFLLDPLCWISSDGNLCARIRKENNTWYSHLEINKLPLRLLRLWLPPDLKPEGSVNATAEVKLHDANKLEGFAHVVLPAGAVSYPLLHEEQGRWKYTGGKIDITLNDSGLLATSEIAISNTEYFKAKFTLPKVNLLTLDKKKQIIQASAELNIINLGLIEAILPEVNNVKGEIGFNGNVSGTLEKPRYKAKVYLNKGTLRIPRLGLKVEQIKLKGQSDDLEKFEFQLAAHSGQGQIAIKGQTILNNKLGWPTSLSIKGENFEVSHIPVSHLRVSPDLKIKLQKNKIDVSGQVHIPFAKLQPKDITTAARVSEDTVIIGSDLPPEEKWLIYTKVRLTLGERVNFYGFGFEGRFAGSLLLVDDPGQLTKATGEINIPQGRYEAYGQRLKVEHGRLLFSGGPATNPGLDIQAERHIGNVTAGLKVTGTLNYPKIELFSIPAMGQTDILSYLLLGRPIESATGNDGEMMAKAALALSLVGGDTLARRIGDRFGIDEMRVESSSGGDQASLVIGRYLSPKLYVGYGVGLIESFNTFNVRYQISDKWQIKGESGESHGADLLYTIER